MSDYIQSIADTYLEHANQICLSPLDIDLIVCWQKEEIPVFIVLRVLEEIGERAARKRVKIRRLSYFQEEVEASFSDWREGQVGR